MRTYKVLSAVIIAVIMISVPVLSIADTSDADVDEKASAVYFKSKEGLSSDEIAKYIDIDMSPSFIQKVLVSVGDFNFGSNGFSITGVKTSGYFVETGMASSISSSAHQYDAFRIVQLSAEIELRANSDGSTLFAGEFNGDTVYGFEKHISVKQNETMVLKGTLRTEWSYVVERSAESSNGRYLINGTLNDCAERTELDFDVVYRTLYGMEQSFRLTGSYEGYDSHRMKLDTNTYNIDKLALGDKCNADRTDDVSGKGHIVMAYEGKEYSSESNAGTFTAVYGGDLGFERYSGKQTFVIDAASMMSEDTYKSLYSEVKLKDVFDNFTGTNQELLSKIPSIGSVDEGDFDKVDKRVCEEISSIKGEQQNDTSGQIMILAVCVLAAVAIVLIAAIILTHRKKNRWH